ncbi:hypothetical protein D3C80_1654460 [compost metagenome]
MQRVRHQSPMLAEIEAVGSKDILEQQYQLLLPLLHRYPDSQRAPCEISKSLLSKTCASYNQHMTQQGPVEWVDNYLIQPLTHQNASKVL